MVGLFLIMRIYMFHGVVVYFMGVAELVDVTGKT